ncbi:NAD-dependent epimerase/dehydratase family protein [Methylophilaceae bacterium]|nr:NAD-dependent epimerase/dehydratase family protein [Methylophilaceae bacterium]
MKKTLIIGGGGYIGSHLSRLLLQRNREVVVLSRGTIPKFELPNPVKYIVGDYADEVLMAAILKDIDEVVHLAYATIPNTSFENPLVDLLENVPPVVRLFASLAKNNIHLLLVSSGGTVYGDIRAEPLKEELLAKPLSPYGVTKLTLEHYAYLYSVTHNLKYVCVRPSNVYGVGQRPFVGQGFVSTSIAAVLKRMPIKIFGDGENVRDYIYIDDVVYGIFLALEKGRLGETYNIGTGVGSSNIEVIKMIYSMLNLDFKSIDIKFLPSRIFDVKYNVLDATKLSDETGWTPITELNDGLNQTYLWLKDSIYGK